MKVDRLDKEYFVDWFVVLVVFLFLFPRREDPKKRRRRGGEKPTEVSRKTEKRLGEKEWRKPFTLVSCGVSFFIY